MMRQRCLGLDIGGANLKAATNDGWTAAKSFPLWKAPEQLAEQLRSLIGVAPEFTRIAVTMTGELADCFASKQSGVAFIVDAVVAAVEASSAESGNGTTWSLGFYGTNGRFLDAAAAKTHWQTIAASNWHAMASWLATEALQAESTARGILIDLGSTTCDVIPFERGDVTTEGHTDLTRMIAGELIYTGVDRSPLCAVLPSVWLDGQHISLAQEFFASMQDVYVLRGEIPADDQDFATADGRPRNPTYAAQRLARLLCSDADELPSGWLASLAEQAKTAQRSLVLKQIQAVHARFQQSAMANGKTDTAEGKWYLCGQGEFLLRDWVDSVEPRWPVVSVAQQFGAGPSRCGPAFALAQLAMM